MATYTDNYQLTKPTYAEQADIGVINSNMNIIDDIMHSSQISLAPAYDSTKSYAEGDKVMYELLMYKCISPTTGVWDGSKWERTTASESGGGGSAELDILGEASGAVASFADGASAGLAKCIVEIVPKQAGSGTPSPDNVRAISGSSEVKVYVNQKNFLENKNTVGSQAINGITFETRSDGSVYVHGTNTGSGTTSFYIGVTVGGSNITLPEGNYILSGCPSGGGSGTYFQSLYYDNTASNNFNIFDFGSGQTYTLDNDTNTGINVRIGIARNASVDAVFYPMIRKATDSEGFEPYNGTTYTIPLGQTVYGGQLNVLTGELTIDRELLTLDGSNDEQWFKSALTSADIYGYNDASDTFNNDDIIVNEFGFVNQENYNQIGYAWKGSSNNQIRFGYAPYGTSDLTSFKTWLGNNSITITAYLSTPQTVQLTGQEVRSILGQNNISADTGDIDIVYVKASAPIQPNPTGTPTATLSKLGIEGTVFEIPSGGGGSSGIDYLTTEHVVGTAEDENGIIKPLYEKMTYIPSLPNATETEYSLGVINIRKVYDVECIVETSTIALPLFYNAGNDNNSKIQMYVSDKLSGKIKINTFNDNRSSMSGTVIIRYTKTTD